MSANESLDLVESELLTGRSGSGFSSGRRRSGFGGCRLGSGGTVGLGLFGSQQLLLLALEKSLELIHGVGGCDEETEVLGREVVEMFRSRGRSV